MLRLSHDKPIRVETLDHGMQTGKPSIAFILEFPDMVVVAETSVKLFQLACYATLSRYGDLTAGAVSGKLDKGTAHLTFSSVSKCPSCSREIPSSCKYCMECGAKL
jgi:hypothetical protein